jgi:glycine/D-amino acid oxidase-like deaminating enzyme
MDVVIVGAGSFGASLAWWLSRAGEAVTLVDQLEPGDRRASSGGETRLLRCGHGDEADYTAMALRARTLWRELEADSGEELLVECGVAWFAHGDHGWETQSERTMAELGIPTERVDGADLYPSFRGDDLAFVLLEPEGGVLRAQRGVRALVAQAAAAGARMVRGRARPQGRAAVLEDSTRLEGDVVIWACGSWLRGLFGELVPLTVTAQEQLFFDGGPGWHAPAWVDYARAMYGTGDIDGLGVKAALDVEGPPLDPDAELADTTTTEPDVRAYLSDRFPALARVPLARARSCRYELTPDTDFIAAPHPEQPGVWLVGGGSGHGFKHGPALAERLADAIAQGARLPDSFALGGRTRVRSLRTAGADRVS